MNDRKLLYTLSYNLALFLVTSWVVFGLGFSGWWFFVALLFACTGESDSGPSDNSNRDEK